METMAVCSGPDGSCAVRVRSEGIGGRKYPGYRNDHGTC